MEIYGGQQDYGPLGCSSKRSFGRRCNGTTSSSSLRLRGARLINYLAPQGVDLQGHIQGFTDPLAECSVCQERSRADNLLEDVDLVPGHDPEDDLGRRSRRRFRTTNVHRPACKSSAEESFTGDVQHF